ncbi:Aste57867_10664 [Aphanomyces stellatus]|uniref:Aste57867_10664 protein n=1 Tax=Aphanomyces stellatus TaxID=120398 RepID=A0A485KRH5_9STRA|nr:hypothetical protein As57867_010624 [Aphanomyces stellatus]VFT87536.1 Aste57867_10664 [Aphanomyces stellatus]
MYTSIAFFIVLAATAANAMEPPCTPGAIQTVLSSSLATPTGAPCLTKLQNAIPASAYGNKTVIAEATARTYESNPEYATWWTSAVSDLKAIIARL